MRSDNHLLRSAYRPYTPSIPAWRDWAGAVVLWALYVVLLWVMP